MLFRSIGTYDIGILIPMVHNLRDILQEKGYNYQFQEWHEGHSWGNWKGHLRLSLVQFFPYTSGLNETPHHPDIKLGPNQPNPFRDHTMIPYSAPIGSKIELILVDMSGRKVETIFSGSVSRSDNIIEYHHKKLPGQYILTLRKDEKIRESMLIQAL